MRRVASFDVTAGAGLGSRHVAVTRVWLDADGVHVAYEVDDDDTLAWPYPELEGRDDAGRDCLPRGGAMSPSRGGRRDGTLTCEPRGPASRR